MSATYTDLTLTNFPDSLDTFLTYLNIVASDGPLIQQYIDALEAGNQTQANQILAQIPSASQKIIKATDLNKLTQAMLAVERFYQTDIQPYVENKQEEWLNVINQFSYKGAWSSGTAYLTNNMVSYVVNGVTLLYLATATPPVGTLPTNQTYWRLLTIQGQQGPSGVGLSYRQEWNVSTSYQTNNAVTYDGALWMALQPSTAIQPGTNDQYWRLILSMEATTYPIQDTVPVAQANGELWFNTQSNPTEYYYLETLSTPADSTKIWNGYEAYDDQGNLVTGTFETYTYDEILSDTTRTELGLQSGATPDAAFQKIGDSLSRSVAVTLTTGNWSSNTQTVTVQGVSADETAQLIQPVPAIASQANYVAAGILCTNQAANSLTFTCTTVPTANISMYIVITELL